MVQELREVMVQVIIEVLGLRGYTSSLLVTSSARHAAPPATKVWRSARVSCSTPSTWRAIRVYAWCVHQMRGFEFTLTA